MLLANPPAQGVFRDIKGLDQGKTGVVLVGSREGCQLLKI